MSRPERAVAPLPPITSAPGESFRLVLRRAFQLAAIPERELAERMGLNSQVAAHMLLDRAGANGGQASLHEDKLRAAALALGYDVVLTLVPRAEGAAAAPGPGPSAPKKKRGRKSAADS